jgi:timeless
LARATEKNPMLFVEALFSHQFPHRHVERCNAVYVSEELKMLVARDMLIEQTGRELQEERDIEDENVETITREKYSGDDEDEMEFVETVETENNQSPKKSNPSHARSKRIPESKDREKDTVTNTAVDDSIEKELDEDENRWNDRRSFVPKRKIVDSSTKDTEKDTVEENVESVTKEGMENNDSPQKRIRVNFEDSDDEEEFNVAPSKRTLSNGKARQLLEDSDEDE